MAPGLELPAKGAEATQEDEGGSAESCYFPLESVTPALSLLPPQSFGSSLAGQAFRLPGGFLPGLLLRGCLPL